ncbi:unnamed protein product [Gordionus sp. m RMFG-2023]
MNSDIERVAKSCDTCNMWANVQARNKENKWPETNIPCERIYVNFLEYEKRKYFIIVNAGSKWIDCQQVSGLTTKVALTKIKDFVGKYKLMETLVSDGGPAFKSRDFDKFCDNINTYCRHHITREVMGKPR